MKIIPTNRDLSIDLKDCRLYVILYRIKQINYNTIMSTIKIPMDNRLKTVKSLNNSRRPNGRCALFALVLVAAASFSFILGGCASTDENLANTRDPKALYDSAMTSYLENRFDESEKTFKTLMEEHPLTPYATEAQIMLGDVCYELERYDDAASYYTRFRT